MTYTLKFKGKFFTKTFKKVKGHLFPKDVPNNKNLLLVVLEDETRIIVNLDKYYYYEISKEMFYNEVEKVKKESQGKAVI